MKNSVPDNLIEYTGDLLIAEVDAPLGWLERDRTTATVRTRAKTRTSEQHERPSVSLDGRLERLPHLHLRR